MRRLRFVVLGLAVTVAACAPPAAQPSAELAAVDAAWAAALNAGDAAKIGALYTDDARLLGPNMPMGQGKAAAEAAFKEMIDAKLQGSLTPLETMAVGDMGHTVGTYEVKAADGTVVDRGKYIETFRKVDGVWKISNDIWNSDMPAGPAGTQVIFAHRVKDSAKWLAAWQGENSRAKMFAAHGAPSVKIFSSAEQPDHHALLVDVTDMAGLEAWMASDEVKTAKAEDGVIDESLVMFTPAP